MVFVRMESRIALVISQERECVCVLSRSHSYHSERYIDVTGVQRSVMEKSSSTMEMSLEKISVAGIHGDPGIALLIGRASCRERVEISVVAVSLKPSRATSSPSELRLAPGAP